MKTAGQSFRHCSAEWFWLCSCSASCCCLCCWAAGAIGSGKDHDRIINALLLSLGVGLAEELIFRAWLWRELNERMSPAAALLIQALVFSLVHTRFNLGIGPMLGLLIGLFLLGLALALQRQLDGGSLWGCIGLHGGLVGGWFLIQSGLVQLSPDAPAWLVGPGGLSPNPLGGLVGIGGLLMLLAIQLPPSPERLGRMEHATRPEATLSRNHVPATTGPCGRNPLDSDQRPPGKCVRRCCPSARDSRATCVRSTASCSSGCIPV